VTTALCHVCWFARYRHGEAAMIIDGTHYCAACGVLSGLCIIQSGQGGML